jgi:hypothetical protein
VRYVQPLVRPASKHVAGRPYAPSVHVPLAAIATGLVLGLIAFIPALTQLASTVLQLVFLYFKTGARG